MALLVLWELTPKLIVPSPLTAELTSYSTQVPVAIEPTLSRGLPEMRGALFQSMPVSVQPSATQKMLPPSSESPPVEPSSVT